MIFSQNQCILVDIITNILSEKNMSTNQSEHTLEQVMLVMEQLATLLIRSGVGLNEFAAACKPVFYRQALLEAKRIGQKPTDSSISLLSGLHRRDTANLRKAISQDPSLKEPPVSQPVSIHKQVIALWLTQDIPETIDIQGDNNTFEALVRQVSKDQHPRSVLTELERIGIVSSNDDKVTLKRNAFTPDPSANEARELLAQNVADHIASGITNLFVDMDKKETGVLEQAVFSDELSLNSINELHKLANDLWFNTLDTVLKRAIELHQEDKTKEDANQRFRLGMYAYHTTDSATIEKAKEQTASKGKKK